MKISALDPITSGYASTVDMLPLVHAGKTWRTTPAAVFADYLNTGTIHINNLVVGGSFTATGATGFLPLTGGIISGSLTLNGPVSVIGNVLSVQLNTDTPFAAAGAGTVMRLMGSDTQSARVFFDGYAGLPITIAGRAAMGTAAAPTTGGGVTAGKTLLALQGQGWGATAYFAASAVNLIAAETFSDTLHGSYITFQTTTIGTNLITERMRLDDAGSLLIGLTARVGTNKLQVVGGTTADVLSVGSGSQNILTIRPGATATSPVTLGQSGTGGITLPADPVVALGAATKQYVDNRPVLPLTGGNLTHSLGLGSYPTMAPLPSPLADGSVLARFFSSGAPGLGINLYQPNAGSGTMNYLEAAAAWRVSTNTTDGGLYFEASPVATAGMVGGAATRTAVLVIAQNAGSGTPNALTITPGAVSADIAFAPSGPGGISFAPAVAVANSIVSQFSISAGGPLTADTGNITTAATITPGNPLSIGTIVADNTGLQLAQLLVQSTPTQVNVGGTITLVWNTALATFNATMSVISSVVSGTTRTVTAAGTVSATTLLNPNGISFSAVYTQPGGAGTAISVTYNVRTDTALPWVRVNAVRTAISGALTVGPGGSSTNNLTVSSGGTSLAPITFVCNGGGGIKMSGGIVVDSLATTSPGAAKTAATYTVAAADASLILAPTAAMTLTLPAAATFPGRMLWLKLVTAFAVNSATANVVPIAGGAVAAAIMPATAGKYCLLQSDGTNWQLMQAN